MIFSHAPFHIAQAARQKLQRLKALKDGSPLERSGTADSLATPSPAPRNTSTPPRSAASVKSGSLQTERGVSSKEGWASQGMAMIV